MLLGIAVLTIICSLCHINRMYEVDTVRIDRNQPHVLKYSIEDSSKHTGVELHHDKCDLTANVMLSRSNTYSGGG